MKLLLFFAANLALSLGGSILLYKLYKVDVSPTIISMALIVIFLVAPQRFHDWLHNKND
jgi:hypothetical protein